MTDGLAVVDKPAGCTSHDVVARCRRIFGQRRVGHAGTLDPDATGVLLVGLGRATRLMRYLTGLPKRYRGVLELGVATSTLDASGTITGRWEMSSVTVDDARGAAAQLTGSILQVPPMVSTLKIDGKRLYELAREGQEVERVPRPVRVERFDLFEVPQGAGLGGSPALGFVVECSSGTYVRSLAADLGSLLGGGAHLRTLRRDAVGPWTEAEAVPLDDLAPADVIDMAAMLQHLASLRVDRALATAVGHGKVIDCLDLGVEGEGPWAVLDEGGALLAVYEAHGIGRAKPAVVVGPESGPTAPR